MPFVSIGVPVFNGARFLTQALDSLLGQSMSDLEIDIADNASTDRTEEICRAYAAKDPRIRYFRHRTNIGAPQNWNFVARQSRGKYFKWASSNDYCPHVMLERCVAVLERERDVVLCHGKTCLVDEESGRQEEYAHDISVMETRPHLRFKTLCRTLALNNAQSGVIRRETLDRTQFDRAYPGGDMVLMAELALQGRIVLLPEILLFRRMGRASFSSLLTTAEMQAFFDPRGERNITLSNLRRHLDFFASALRAPITLSEKMLTLMIAVRHAAWDRKRLWTELRNKIVGSPCA
jgi:glycosyltransferase involved in cell wall biosynthesis